MPNWKHILANILVFQKKKNLSLPDQPFSTLSIHQYIIIFENEKIWQPSGMALAGLGSDFGSKAA